MKKQGASRISRGASELSTADSVFTAYLSNHAQVFISSLGKLYRSPVSNLMTIAVIGIALAFPSGLYVLLKNLQNVSGGWDGGTQISLFAKLSISDAKAQALGRKLQQNPQIKSVEVLSREEAMNEFEALSGFGDALEALDSNPLPAVILIQPQVELSPTAIERLLHSLRQLPEIDIAQLDMQWVKRLYSIMAIGERGIVILAVLLALAVLLTVGNTIRLDIQNRRDEIVIIKLIGATNRFIRRPFLYTGFWYGLLGGLLAIIMIQTSLGLLAGPVQQLAGLYDSDFSLTSLGVLQMLGLLAASIFLGLCGSWVAVSRHLKLIEPS